MAYCKNNNFVFPNIGVIRNEHDANAYFNNMMAEHYRRDQERARAEEEKRRNAEEEHRRFKAQRKMESRIMGVFMVVTTIAAFFFVKQTAPPRRQSILPEVAPVPEPPKIVLKPTFIFSAPRLEQIKTHSPANMNSIQAQALFDLFGPVDDEEEASKKDCCNEADILCRVRAIMPKYIDKYVPSFAIPYLFPAEPQVDDKPEEKPLNMTKIAFEVLEHSFVTKTTPAFLPTGPLTKETAMSFFQLMHGDFRNAKQEDAEEEMAQNIEERIERCPESDSFYRIFASVVELLHVEQTAEADNTWFTGRPGSSRPFGVHRFVNVAFSRFREMPEVRYKYHLQGSLQYELLRNHVDFKSECESMWEELPALKPIPFTKRVWIYYDNFQKKRRGEKPEKAPRMPMLKERACYDASFAASGVCPVRVATCHAFARDQAPVDYEENPPTPYSGPSFVHVLARKKAAPLIPDDCHVREHLMYDFLRNHFDYSNVCIDFWNQHPHTSPSAKREKKVVVDGKKTTLWNREFTKNPLPMDSFCYSFLLDMDGKNLPKDVPEILKLLHSN